MSSSAEAGAGASATAGASTAAVPAASSSSAAPSSALDATPLLHLDDCLTRDVHSVGENHSQLKTRQLSALEQFYVHVAEVYQQQTLQKHVEEKAAQSAAGAAKPPAALLPSKWPFARMEDKLLRAHFQMNSMVHNLEELLHSAGQKGVLAQQALAQATTPQQKAQIQSQQERPPILTLAERNTEMHDLKLKQEAALQSEHHRLEHAAAAAAAASGSGAAAMSDGEDGPPLSAEDELAEFLRDDDLDDVGGGASADDVPRMVLEQDDQLLGGVSLATRRNRLGAMLMLKRKQYTSAKNVFLAGLDQLRRSTESDRKFLSGVGQLAKYWTIRTVATDSSSNVQLPSGSAAAAAAASAQGAHQARAPPTNPFQPGLGAGSVTPYPSLMIDYRLGTLDISLDRGKTWLYRNDAGELFVDEAVGKEPAASSGAAASVKASDASSTKVDADVAMKAESADASVPAVASWMKVSAQLQRAQHQLLYKHLYQALMLEARDLRVASHNEQLKAAAGAFNPNPSGSSASASASAAGSSFIPPPATHAPRPWIISEITARSIRIEMQGFSEGVGLEWPTSSGGISAPFGIRTTQLDRVSPVRSEEDARQMPDHAARLLVSQCLCMLLEQTMKNSLGQRRSLELVHESDQAAAGGASSRRGDPAVAATGVGSSSTGQEESSWPNRAPSMLQFLVMAIGHWRLVREVRAQIARVQKDQSAHQQLPPFRVRPAKRLPPFVYKFNIIVGPKRRVVLEATVRGLHFQVITRLPPAQVHPAVCAAFGHAQQQPTSSRFQARAYSGAEYAVAETILCSSAEHFGDVLCRALSWHQ